MSTTSRKQVERVHKTLRLDPHTIDSINQTAGNLGLNFSRTVELLVTLGLDYTHKHASEAGIALQRVVIDQGVSRALNRYLKLLAQTTIAANEAKEMAQQVFFIQLRQLADTVSEPDAVYEALMLYPEEDAMHEALYAIYEQRQERGQQRAEAHLKQTLDMDEALWKSVTRWDEGLRGNLEIRTELPATEAAKSVSEQHAFSEIAPDERIRDIVDKTVERNLNRYLKLLVRSILAATEAKEMAQQVFFATLCNLATDLTDPQEAAPALMLDVEDPLDKALYDLYQQRQKRSRNRAVRQLKRVIAIDAETWQQLRAEVEAC